ncbi:MAG: ectoine hydrolase DoeA [Paracoccus sp. (in: a-proteobacteria)]|uniref:ectoine hydrolase DoeA n=1 Tax=unclassified Paracoccus (in: a-proteobacteria) TaxID=2688777 RepID=UPI000C498173|nr:MULTISPECIES: ectoine hydrolase DoeA [unclassified Paracoccus (in: a-proteobacteria)]MAN57024.1 ectoine hydrolase DoeA [Paracoccus sp. (in: a-proteobacteria)]MBA48717.1 ectoine hydrolase DoeA [Paracoccus sp. (in: a-proteobacteria)]|tara:strand:- start:1043 stop:2239 length:1197 start_codon:yes stop_codon:yes gene_type:complete
MPELQRTPYRFSTEEYEQRLRKTRSSMEKLGLDLLIVSDPSNMAWLTGYDGWSFYVHQCVIVGPDGPPIWFGRGQDAQGALRTVWMPDDYIIGYPDYYVQSVERHPMDYLWASLATRNWHRGFIGVEMDNYWYSAKAHERLVHGLPEAQILDATGLVNWQRAIKTPKELEYMRKAARIVERMHRRIADKVEVGQRKCDLVAEIYDAGLRFDEWSQHGGDYPAIVPLLPSGPDASAPHLTWDDQPMKQDEGTFFEIAGCYQRYHVPLSRTIFLGKPPQDMLEAEKAVLEGMEAGLGAARAGNTCEDVANAFFTVLDRHGIVKDNRTGYPIGLSYPPDWGERTMSLRRGDQTELKPGMTFHFMTGLWMEGWGYETTESIVITEREPELFCNIPRRMLVKS